MSCRRRRCLRRATGFARRGFFRLRGVRRGSATGRGFNGGGEIAFGIDDQSGQGAVDFGEIEQVVEGGFASAVEEQGGAGFREAVAEEAGAGVGEFDNRWADAPGDGGAQVVVIGLGFGVDQQECFVEAA